MTFQEQAIAFACEGEQLLGILCGPVEMATTSGMGVVIVVGGPQYRAGSHRQFVLLTRALAARGHHCLRFDCRGMGDSSGPTQGFEQVGADIHAAIETLRARCPQLRRITLWGLCDGASASLLYLQAYGARARVDGLCLLNPWVRSTESLAKTQVKHYYTQRLMQREFWLKLLRGGTGWRALREFAGNLRTAAKRSPAPDSGRNTYQERMAAAWRAFPGQILLLLSGDDYVAKEFLDHAQARPAWAGLLGGGDLERHDLPGIDHTFSTGASRSQAEQLTACWLDQAFQATPHAVAPNRA